MIRLVMASRGLIYVSLCFLLMAECLAAFTLSSRLIHRFSDEMKAIRVSRSGRVHKESWPERRRNLEYYHALASGDIQRQKMRLGRQHQLLFPSEGSETMSFGNDFGWLYYTWIDIGTPKVSFLVALDSGSDLLWVPCDCVQCAPLSSGYYSNLDRDLNQYNPTGSNTSKLLSCSHRLCELGSNCKSTKQPCPYLVNYKSEETYSSGSLFEDILHLVADNQHVSKNSVQASIVLGCGSKQSGGYLNGVAPDGLMGLGMGEISVPSFLAEAGFVKNSFSLCFDDDDSGTIFFGDQGLETQQVTPFLPVNEEFVTYIVGVMGCCIGGSCVEKTNFKALIDSGSSFTYLPNGVYKKVVEKLDWEVNTTKSSFDGYPWEYCYKYSSPKASKLPSIALQFSPNNSFVVQNPFFPVNDNQGFVGFCLAIQPTDDTFATIGQNFMTGYRIVFDRENMKLGWSLSKCEDLTDGENMPSTSNSTSPNPLPTEQQKPNGQAVSPAVAGRAPSKSFASSSSTIDLAVASSVAYTCLQILM